MNEASRRNDEWMVLPELRWRAPPDHWDNINGPQPVLEQRWQHVPTGRTAWRLVATVIIGEPVSDAGMEHAEPSLATSANMIVHDMIRMRQMIDAIRPHVQTWVTLLETYVHSLPAESGPAVSGVDRAQRLYAEHELIAMKRTLGALVSLPSEIVRSNPSQS